MCAVVALFGEPSQPAGATSFDCAATETELNESSCLPFGKVRISKLEEVQFYCADASL